MSVFCSRWSAGKNSSNGMRYVDVDGLNKLHLNHTITLQDSSMVTPVTLRVDPYGYFLYWTDQNEVQSYISLPILSFISFNCRYLLGNASAGHVYNS